MHVVGTQIWTEPRATPLRIVSNMKLHSMCEDLRNVGIALALLLVSNQECGGTGEVAVGVDDSNVPNELVVHHLIMREGERSRGQEAGILEDIDGVHDCTGRRK